MFHSRPFLAAALVLMALAALVLRLPRIADRPLHGDEAINTDKFNTLWQEGKFLYDPHEYHGPTLYYFTLPGAWLSGAKTYAQTTEMTYRGVPAVFGVGLILLLWLVRDGLGHTATIVAGMLTAISSAMVFYSRYYIHEMLLVFFTFGAIAFGWRYARTRQSGWAIGCGAMLALMYATKETWIIALFAMGLAVGLTLLWGRLVDRRPVDVRPWLQWKTLVIAAGVALVLWYLFFTSFFTNRGGAWDSILTYWTYFQRGTGPGEHDHPFNYYLDLLAWWQPKRSKIVRTEAFILIMAALGVGIALMPRRKRGAAALDPSSAAPMDPQAATQAERGTRADFARFLAFYTITMVLVYSTIRYKTPWCMLSFLHGMILLGGVAASALLRWSPLWLRFIVAGVLAAGAGHLAFQAYEINFDQKYRQYASNRFNPYVYSQPTVKLYDLTQRLDQLAAVLPEGQTMRIRVVAPAAENWPLPWYLRKYSGVDYALTPQGNEAGMTVIIASQDAAVELQEQLGEGYYPEYHGLRPGVALVMFIEKGLWERFLETRR